MYLYSKFLVLTYLRSSLQDFRYYILRLRLSKRPMAGDSGILRRSSDDSRHTLLSSHRPVP